MTEITYQRPVIWDVLERGGRAYNPLLWQAEHVHSRPEKRIIAACGRRSGKSWAMKAEVAREVLRPVETVLGVERPPLVYIIGPTTETAMKVWQPVWDLFVPPDSGTYEPPLGFLHQAHDKNRGWIQLINGAEIFRKTADDPRSLQGDRVTLAIPDEAHEIEEEAWENLMPALADSQGRLIAIGVPKGRKRFRSYWELGKGVDPAFYSFSVPTHANPVFVAQAQKAGFEDVVEYLRQSPLAADLTEDEFQRQILARWVEQDGAVFANFLKYFTGTGPSFDETGAPTGGPYIMSLDLGKIHDFTVAYVGDVAKQEIVARLRFNKIDYMDQVPQIADLYRKYRCRFIHMDTNGPGEAPSEMLRRDYGCGILPFKWTNESKQALISVMVRETQRGNITYLADDEVLKKEMSLFEGVVSPGGTLRYDAPKGFYDDCVIAAALLIQKMARNKTMASNPIHKPYATFAGQNQGRRRVAVA